MIHLANALVPLLVSLVLSLHVACLSAAEPRDKATTSVAQRTFDLEVQKLELERIKVEIERAKLAEEQRRTKVQEATEARLARAEQDRWMQIVAAIGTPLTIATSLLIASLGYFFQARATKHQVEAQFKLKAAELAMAARSSDQVYNKAKALAELLPDELGHLGETFDPDKFKLGQSVERRQALIELLAAHPDVRKDTIRTWAVLFPHDRNDWLKPLLTQEKIDVGDA